MRPLKTKIDNLISSKNYPFLGYAGVGARFKYFRYLDKSIIRETIASQLWIVGSLALLSLYPLWLVVFRSDEINGGWGGKLILLLTVALSLPFLYKYLVRLVSGRRIEFQRRNNQICFFESKKSENKKIHFQDIRGFRKVMQNSYSAEDTTETYVIFVTDSAGEEHPLCASDKEANIDYILRQIKLDLPGKFENSNSISSS